ncbi:MAG TPA: class I SAM-dependent methyltransferase [Ktedonobacteraceae bacterium]|nr:class I SAM-dependent methyltransferase [Ktedonobacteraceae bacterium]
MPLRLSLLEYMLSRLNILPTPLLDAPLASGISRVLVTACELGVFDTLGRGKLSTPALAEKLQCKPEKLQLLLQLLVTAGYLRQRKAYYSNTRVTRRWLMSSSPVSLAPYIVHSPDIVGIWEHIPEVLFTGKPAICMPYEADASKPETQKLLARHYAGLASLALALGGEIVRRVHVPAKATQLLDVGGSHAGYSALFCQKYPRLHATIMDIQPGIEAGQSTARLMKLEDRMSFICTDVVHDEFTSVCPASFDIALYFHIAHLLQPEINQAVLRKVAQTLKPGGMLVFVDQITDQPHRSRLATLMVQFMALTMATIGGICYPFSTVKTWLEQVGMGEVRQHHLVMPGATLITAIKKR